MLRATLCLLLIQWAGLAWSMPGSYNFAGHPISFEFDPTIRAEKIDRSKVRIESENPFLAMGFKITSSVAGTEAMQTPVWFSSGAVGVMKNRVAVRFVDGFDRAKFNWSETKGLNWKAATFNSQLVYVNLQSARASMEFANSLADDKRVKYAHPLFHFQIEARAATDEPLFPDQWHLENTGQRGGTPGVDLGARAAWTVTEGRSEIVVGLIDLGFEQDHPDLIDTWLINEGEIPDNGRDDDGNGLIDDVRGWNYDVDSNKLIYGSASSHGTATAGIIGAPANGIGVSGVCPGCRILPVVIYSDIEDAVAAFYYARDRGASIISNSWGYRIGTPETDVLVEAISDVAKNSRRGKGISILFAMPNFNSDVCRPGNPDISAHPDVIAISSVDFHDDKVDAAGFGSCLKFVGPTAGSQVNAIVTTDRIGERGYNHSGIGYDDLANMDYTQSFYGTSAATPAIAGVFGLVYSVSPDVLTAADVYRLVKGTAIKVSPQHAEYDSDGFSVLYGYGRPHAGSAVAAAVSGLPRY